MTLATPRPTAPRTASPPEQVAAALLAGQAAVGVALWLAYESSATFRGWFELVADHPAVTDAFFYADMVTVAASATAAWALWRARPWAPLAVALTAGLILYPTVYLVGFVALADDGGGAALAVMIPPAVINVGLVLAVRPRQAIGVQEPGSRHSAASQASSGGM